ncbi:hypothetical protein PZH32_13310, partial [Adlercreutzia equolifaciens]|nr:hypothetical protein [Adlercreutzia equolifaciens]
ARTAVRCGGEVTVVYRRRLEDMTALAEEVEAAIAEGVEMLPPQAPEALEVDETGAVRALVTRPQMPGPVRGGRCPGGRVGGQRGLPGFVTLHGRGRFF